MAAYVNPYMNPMYAEAAKNIALAITGDPEKAGKIEGEQAAARLSTLKGDRQQMENVALTQIADAMKNSGGTPDTIDQNNPALMQIYAQSHLNPTQFQPGFLASKAAALSYKNGAPGDDVLAREALIAHGTSPSADFASTPDRADELKQNKYDAEYDKAMDVRSLTNEGAAEVQRIRNQAPAKAGKAGARSIKNAAGIMAEAMRGVSGATELDSYKRPYVVDDAANYLNDTGAKVAFYDAEEKWLNEHPGDELGAMKAGQDKLGLKGGTKFDPHAQIKPKKKIPLIGTDIPFTGETGPSFIGPDGAPVDLSGISNALAPPEASGPVPVSATQQNPPAAAAGQGQPKFVGSGGKPVEVNSPDEAMKLPSGTNFTVRGRPDLKIKRRP